MKKVFVFFALIVLNLVQINARVTYYPSCNTKNSFGLPFASFKNVDMSQWGSGDTLIIHLSEPLSDDFGYGLPYNATIVYLNGNEKELENSDIEIGNDSFMLFLEDYDYTEEGTSDSIRVTFYTPDDELFVSVVSMEYCALQEEEEEDNKEYYNTIYYIDFNESSEGWNIKDFNLGGLGYVWKQDSYYGMKASSYVNKKNYETESWLISPTIDITNAKKARVSFESYRNKGYDDQMKLKITTDDGETWEDVEGVNFSDGSDSYFHFSGFGDITKYVGNKIKLAYAYSSTTSAGPTLEILNTAVQADTIDQTVPQTVYFGLDSAFLSLEEAGSSYVAVTESFHDVKVTMSGVNRGNNVNAAIIAPYPISYQGQSIEVLSKKADKIFVPLYLRTKKWYNTQGANDKQVVTFYYTLDKKTWLPMGMEVKNDTCNLMKMPVLPDNTAGIKAVLASTSKHIGFVSFSYMLLDREVATPTITAADNVEFCDIYATNVATQTKEIHAAWQNLTNDIHVSLTGSSAFTTEVTSVKVDNTSGIAHIAVKFEPETEGEHTATLTLSSEGAETKEIHLTGRYMESIVTRIEDVADNRYIEIQSGRVVADEDFRIYDVLGRDVTYMNGALNGVYIVRFDTMSIKVGVTNSAK